MDPLSEKEPKPDTVWMTKNLRPGTQEESKYYFLFKKKTMT